MKMFLWGLLLVIVMVAGLGAGLLLTPLGERPLAALLPVGEVEAIDFAAPQLTDKPNQYLICPPGLCGAAAHGRSPVFEIPVEQLSAGWRRMLAARPRVALLAEREDGRQLDYVQRSARFRFPDIITVRFVATAPARSSLAIYSRSIYGRRDFGVNRARVEAWLDRLCETLPSNVKPCPHPRPGAIRR
jgi:uncharacterized protein (DUF1499 family)